MTFESHILSELPDAIAPDGSEIRLLSTEASRGSMVHCRLSPGLVTRPVRHLNVQEMWYCIGGTGRLWRFADGQESVLELSEGVSCSILPGTCFQFRCDGDVPLEIVIATVPPWPGEQEAGPCEGKWPPSV